MDTKQTVQASPESFVICACWSCRVPLMLALKSVIAAMLADKPSISSSIFLKSFFIFLMVSEKKNMQTKVQRFTSGQCKKVKLHFNSNLIMSKTLPHL